MWRSLIVHGLALTLPTGCWADEYKAVISVAGQEMQVSKNRSVVASFPVSTSKFGLGNEEGSWKTPLGQFVVTDKIGTGVPKGGKFKDRQYTGKVYDLVRYNPKHYLDQADYILTRILWLHGVEDSNRNARNRYIYIHGTNQEHLVGKKPSSYGCIRMRNGDVIELFKLLPIGTPVRIQREPLPYWEPEEKETNLGEYN